ncbi:dihydrofolate reductase family protein [Halosimplex sp. TS25]|uniref:dihydrofolate reductase family protein n=1 Tax=Halosimplex rarum TaxID=3396619 RepID=UPI0039ECE1D7
MSDGRITLYVAASVDGFIAAEDGSVAWLDEFERGGRDGEEAGSYDEFIASVDCLVMGATTYEQVLDFGDWPYSQKPTYVVTSRDLPRANDAVELFAGDVGDLAERLRGEYDHTWVVGGAQLAQSFLRTDQIDRLRLNLVPVLLGDGIRLFGDGGVRKHLERRETTAYDSGIVELQYEVGYRASAEQDAG